MKIIALLAIVLAGFLAYVRLAPSRAELWHQSLVADGGAQTTLPGGYRVHLVLGPQARADFERLVALILTAPDTRLLAGSAEAGHVTVISRTRVVGFPDYTTLQLSEDGTLSIYGRLRFGRSDLGVNKARIRAWLTAAQIDHPA